MIRPVPNSSARPAGPQTTPFTALLICVIHSSMVNFPLLHKTKKQTEPTKGSVCKIQAHSFSAAGHAAFPAVPLCVPDDGSVLLPERYSRLSLRPYTFGTRCCGLLQSAGQCFPTRLSSSFSVHSCARQKDYTIFCPHVQALFPSYAARTAGMQSGTGGSDSVGREFLRRMIRGWDPVAAGNRAGAPNVRGESSRPTGHTPKNTTAPGRRGIGSGRRGRQCLYQGREMA